MFVCSEQALCLNQWPMGNGQWGMGNAAYRYAHFLVKPVGKMVLICDFLPRSASRVAIQRPRGGMSERRANISNGNHLCLHLRHPLASSSRQSVASDPSASCAWILDLWRRAAEQRFLPLLVSESKSEGSELNELERANRPLCASLICHTRTRVGPKLARRVSSGGRR